jgi:hypothetical protein
VYGFKTGERRLKSMLPSDTRVAHKTKHVTGQIIAVDGNMELEGMQEDR